MKSRNRSKLGALNEVLPDLSPVRRSGDFRLLYFGQMISGFGSALTYVVLPIQTYQLTHSMVMVGLLSVAEFAPMLLIAFLAGALADHFDRGQIILGCESLMAAALMMLIANALLPHPQLLLLFLAAALLASLNSVHRPAIEAMTPQLVRQEEMTAVSALNSIRGNASFIAGPGLGGWIAVTFGPAMAFGLDAATYLFAIGAILAMRQKRFTAGEKRELSWHTLTEGWRYALQRRDLLGTYRIDMNAMYV